MSKLQEIKASQLDARKNKFTSIASLLTTIIGESEMVGKNDNNRETTDDDVLKVLKRFEKGMIETLGYLKPGDARIADVEGELKIVRAFLPAKMTNEQVKDDIVCVMIANDLKYEQKSLGIITKELRAKYGDQFDGQQVSSQFKAMLV